MNILDECSPKELRILEFYAKALKTDPKGLKRNLLAVSLNDRARVLAFIQFRVPALYEDIKELLED